MTQLWQVLEKEIDLDGTVTSMSFDSVVAMGVVATSAGTVWYINWPQKSSVRLVSGHSSSIHGLACSVDDTVLATGSDDGTVRVWSVADHTQIMQASCDCSPLCTFS